MKPIEILKERQKHAFASNQRLQIQQNNLLNEISDLRTEMVTLQTEVNELQIAIEKLEQA